MRKPVFICDTTLCEGLQMAKGKLSIREKLRIAELLAGIGVHQIEAGIPAMGGDEKEVIKQVVNAGLNASIMAWNRAVVDDIKHSLDCGVDAVVISISASDIYIKHKLHSTRQRVLEDMVMSCEFAKRHNLYVCLNAEDASRSDMEFLVELARVAQEVGVDRLRFCDTVGCLDPFTSYERVKTIVESVGIPIEVHMHNHLGMATANTLAGLKAGGTYASVTVMGFGEWAGHAALEEVVMALKYLYGINLGLTTERFREIAEYAARASGRQLPPWKPIVGNNIFAHESGIHTDGVLKNAQTYEIFPPEEVGLTRQIVIGKHSGTAAIKIKFAEYGIALSQEEAAAILERVRSAAVELKRSLFDKELIYLYEDYLLHRARQGKIRTTPGNSRENIRAY